MDRNRTSILIYKNLTFFWPINICCSMVLKLVFKNLPSFTEQSFNSFLQLSFTIRLYSVKVVLVGR